MDYKTDKKLTYVTSEVVITKSHEKVWKTLYEDFGNVALFNPNIDNSNFIEGHTIGAEGAQRQCNVNENKYVKESIINVEEGKGFALVIDEAHGIPFNRVYVEYQITALEMGKTKVVQHIYYRTKPALMGQIMKGKLGNSFESIIVGLKYHMETGDTVTKKKYKKIKKVFRNMEDSAQFTSKVS
ncbi:MAG: hypothetical protein COA50_06320 [Flavobacteriaceae bacterium]|nr:MAG: hypothetical protein COA50_06320 [Flavobacteriaceae bacterium]